MRDRVSVAGSLTHAEPCCPLCPALAQWTSGSQPVPADLSTIHDFGKQVRDQEATIEALRKQLDESERDRARLRTQLQDMRKKAAARR